MQIRIIPNEMADKPKRKRKPKLVTLDPPTVVHAQKIGKLQKPPIDTLSRLIDTALAFWSAHHDPKKK